MKKDDISKNGYFELLAIITRLSEGDYEVRGNPVGCNDEINVLINKFNLLAENISKEVKKDTNKNIKKISNKLEASEKKFKELTDLLPQIVFEVDNNGKFLFLNNAAYKLTGYTENDFDDNLSIFDILMKEDRQRAIKNLKEGLISSKVNVHEYYIRKKNNTVLPILIYSAPIIKNNKSIGLRGIGVDISQLKKVEKEIDIEKERLSITLGNIEDGVITTDSNGKIIIINSAAENITGWNYKEAIGENIKKLFIIKNEYTKEIYQNQVDFVIRNKIKLELDKNIILITKEKKEVLITLNIVPIIDKLNNVYGSVIVFNDITQKIKLEEELIRNQKFESIRILAGGIAHDFNNILTSLLGNLELASLELENKNKTKDLLSSAVNSARYARELTKQLLTFSKEGSLKKDTASINELLKNISIFSLHGSNVTCKYEIEENLWSVQIDKDQMTQVINNLIINADQAMKDGGQIIISAKNISIGPDVSYKKNGNYIKISISDKGIGINNNNLSKIFDPYYTTKKNGSGLGLAICYSIIKKHNGYIDVNSQIGIGTTFSIYLPAFPNSTNNQDKKNDEDIIFGNGKILIIDDDQNVLNTVGKMLEYLHFSYECVNSCEKGIKLYKEMLISNNKYDIVIIDLTMPGDLGGKEIIKKLKKIDPKIKSIVSSGYCNDPIMANFKKFGFNYVLPKPFTVKELSKALNYIKTR